ncbi:hypothetical protein FISHEDRAFT_74843 [Fistulina hepatica ATCC 64428]|uniref:Uncharacterized protein n=1 Tax=Fistulina hepatica ATCC 64428 TaxID=1128425 RepID=A0A0D7A8A3_9AGAR|nr:hypothetical protein FISHEDRAFT_74843 [Fistulina hepatica ATCC 64428]
MHMTTQQGARLHDDAHEDCTTTRVQRPHNDVCDERTTTYAATARRRACDNHMTTRVRRPHNNRKLYNIKNMTDTGATLLEPAACNIHGLDKLHPPCSVAT